MASEQLSTIVDRAWEVVSLARRVQAELSQNPLSECSADGVSRRLSRLADGFRWYDQEWPARFAQALATAFHKIAHRAFPPSPSVLDSAQQGLDRFCDLLVELEAVGQITRPGSTAVIECLEALTAHSTAMPWELTNLREESLLPSENSLDELCGYSDALVHSSDSLLMRIQRDAESLYAAPVSRIHHLAVTLRNRLAEVVEGEVRSVDSRSSLLAISCQDDAERPAVNERPAVHMEEATVPAEPAEAIVDDILAPPTVREPAESAVPSITRARRVLVIDESPFFRLLFHTAIQAAGYETRVAMSLDETLATVAQDELFGVVVWGGTASHVQTARLVEWIRRPIAAPRAALIAVIDGPHAPADVSPEFDSLVSRTDLPALLNVIAAALGDAPAAPLKIA